MGAVSHSLVLVLLPGAAAECGATLSAGQPRGPRTLTYECRARDADTGAGRAGVPPMVPPGAVRSSYCVVERQR